MIISIGGATLIILYLDILSISRLDLYIFGLKYNSQHFFVFKIPFFTFHKFPTSSPFLFPARSHVVELAQESYPPLDPVFGRNL